MPTIYIIEGEAGCRAAVERAAVAVVVDALRTSATLPYLFDAGAVEVIATASLEHARALKDSLPAALLAGEMGGARIPGFDLANSPTELRREVRAGAAAGGSAGGGGGGGGAQRASALRNAHVIFTSSAGSGRLVACAGANAIVVATTVNARRAARYVSRLAAPEGRDVVIIPAGPVDPATPTPEDWWSASYVASLMGPEIAPECREAYDRAIDDVIGKGLRALFATCPNAQKLQKLGFGPDVAASAEANACRSVPIGAGLVEVPGPTPGHALRLVAASLEDDLGL